MVLLRQAYETLQPRLTPGMYWFARLLLLQGVFAAKLLVCDTPPVQEQVSPKHMRMRQRQLCCVMAVPHATQTPAKAASELHKKARQSCTRKRIMKNITKIINRVMI